MEKKVLVAVDLSENSLKAVDYLGDVMSCHPAVRITLLNVVKEPSEDIMPDADERGNWVERTRAEVLALMEEAARRLTTRGVGERCVCLKIETCKPPVSVAELIMAEQTAGGYDTVVIGRRGMSKKEEFLFGSVSSKVVREAKHCTIWVVS